MPPVDPRIGAYALETLTSGMYKRPLDSLREYIQNSSDSIHDAERSSILASGSGRVDVLVDPDHETLIVRDNGVGLPCAQAEQKLLDIGWSDKDPSANAGFRGIGRLAGLAYCSVLTFTTSARGEPIETVVSLDASRLATWMRPSEQTRRPLVEVLRDCSHVETSAAAPESHYFTVELKGISQSVHDSMLDSHAIRDFLSQIAPVEFDPHTFTYATVINAWASSHGVSIPYVTIVVTDVGTGAETQVFKPYHTHFKTDPRGSGQSVKVQITDIVFEPQDVNSANPYWTWYGKSELAGSIDDDAVAGFRVRKDNISLGTSEIMTELFASGSQSNARFNRWYIGEVHLLSGNTTPNARRDGLEPMGDWPAIKEALAQFAAKRIGDVRLASKTRNLPVVKIQASVRKAVDDAQHALRVGLTSPEHKRTLLAALDSEAEDLNEAASHRENSSEGEVLRSLVSELSETRAEVDDCTEFKLMGMRGNLGRKQTRVIRRILEILRGVLDAPAYGAAETAIIQEFSPDDSDKTNTAQRGQEKRETPGSTT